MTEDTYYRFDNCRGEKAREDLPAWLRPVLDTRTPALHADIRKTYGLPGGPRSFAAAPLQRARINYAPDAADRYSAIVGALQGNPAVAGLIERVLAGGDVTLRIDDGDDTRYDRRSRTIFVSRSKNANQARAAILFELNNAANPHAHTDAAEGVMTTMAERGEAPGGGDYLHVAREMEKDEFISLVNYAHQAQGLGASGPAAAALREKYEALLAQGGGLSYDAFVAQNRRSGHTLDLAQAQHGAFTGKSSAEFPGIPLEFRDPVRYEAYQAGTGSARVRGQIAKTLAAEAGQFPVDARFTAAAPAWNPATIAAGYHQPLATLPVLPSSTAAASVTAASSNDASSSVQAPSLATNPDAGQASVPLATVPRTAPGRVGPSALERRLGFSIALSPEEIEEDLALIRGLS